MDDLYDAAALGTFEDFQRVFTPDKVNLTTGWYTPLLRAVNNPIIAERIRIVDFLIDAGADVNLRAPDGDTPLEALAGNMKWSSEEEFRPFYEVIFARPDLDLTSENWCGDSPIRSIRRFVSRRPLANELLDQALAARGIDIK